MESKTRAVYKASVRYHISKRVITMLKKLIAIYRRKRVYCNARR